MTKSQSLLTVIILAAGRGSRMHSDMPKVMHKIAFKPMIRWIIDTAEALDPAQIITVVGPDMTELEELVSDHSVAVQETQDGTGGAVMAAMPHIKNKSGRVLILLGDEPFVSEDALHEMVANENPSVMAIDVIDPEGLGRMIVNQNNQLEKIVEHKDANEKERSVTLCNAGNFALDYHDLADWLPQITTDNAQGEYYLTDLVEIAAQNNKAFNVVSYPVAHGWGVNNRLQLAEHEQFIQNKMREKELLGGVSMMDPQTVYLSPDCKIGRDVTIEPNVVIGPGVEIGNRVTIKAYSHLEDVKIGDSCEIGPFARLRPGTVLDENVKIGNFVEVKKSTLHKGVKANHLGYIGDAEIGEGTNFSCGAITVNYDGVNKHKTKIGKNSMIGSNVSLIAPIEIGDEAFIAAGSTLSENIPNGALGVERMKPRIIEGWSRKNKEKKKET